MRSVATTANQENSRRLASLILQLTPFPRLLRSQPSPVNLLIMGTAAACSCVVWMYNGPYKRLEAEKEERKLGEAV